MFADFRVHGLNTTFFQCFHHRSTPTYTGKKKEGLPPVFCGVWWRWRAWVAAYAKLDNLAGNKRIAPIGYPLLPFTFRVGLRYTIGHSSSK
jgi:hypothetical protein